MRYEMFIGLRYLLSRRKDRSISIITWISIIGVMLGVVALVVSTAMLNGFRSNMQRAIIGSLPHVTVSGLLGEAGEMETVLDKIHSNRDVLHTSPFIHKEAMLAGGTSPKGTLIRGIDPDNEPNITEIASFLRTEIYPTIPPSEEEQTRISEQILTRLSYERSQAEKKKAGIILGASLAFNLGVIPGDVIKVISNNTRMTPIGDVPRAKEVEVIGIFESGIHGYDEVLAFLDYRLVQRLFNMSPHALDIGVSIQDPEQAPEIANELSQTLEFYHISDWTYGNQSMFQIMKLEKVLIFIVLGFMILVAAFNIISSLTMMVLEKSKEIAILKALGSKDRSILAIFMLQGVVIGVFGTIFGISLGLLICWVLGNFNIVDIPPGVYPGGNHVPILIDWVEIGLIGVIAFLICILVTAHPAYKAAQIEPAESLQHQ